MPAFARLHALRWLLMAASLVGWACGPGNAEVVGAPAGPARARPDAGPAAPATALRSSCGSVEHCLAAIETTAAPGKGINKAEQALAAEIRRHGRAALPGLLRLLGSPDPEVRAL